jgi:hypothetical protein
MSGFVKLLINRMMVTHRAKVGCLIKSDSLFTVNPVCLYRLILTPTATVYYHVERTIYIEGERQIPQCLSIIISDFFKTAIAGYALSLLKLEYFTHYDLSFYQ